MIKKVSTYWWFQIIGWGSNLALSIFILTALGKATTAYCISVMLTCLAGVLVTHIMRMSIHGLNLLQKPITRQILSFLALTLVYAIAFSAISEGIDRLGGFDDAEHNRMSNYSTGMRIFLTTFNYLWLILLWNFIYYIYHYVQRARRQEMDTFRLQALVKSLELRTIKSHINPHFIFNALNSIRALVDENPERARKAITELSNILRSSMKVEQQETVPLQKELDIVEDYLALEQMRFEERLRIEMDIDPDTLDQPVPPMMLQTLVENAIKHGISKQVDGGVIRLESDLVDGNLQIRILNTGSLNGAAIGTDGFGVKSTEDRLNLLYNGNAYFSIKDTNNGMVASTIRMPAAVML